MSKILIVDNLDSFTWNLVQVIREAGPHQVLVIREPLLDPLLAMESDGILLSPGPGLPAEYPRMNELIRHFHTVKPMLGICLGHQALAEFFGARLVNLGQPRHGMAPLTRLTGSSHPLFRGISEPFAAGLYHSWAVSREDFPSCLRVDAESEHGVIMALSHPELPLYGLQFHPESIMTPAGPAMLSNWLSTL